MSNIEHGTRSGYFHFACRCLRCKEAAQKYYQEKKAQRRQNAPISVQAFKLDRPVQGNPVTYPTVNRTPEEWRSLVEQARRNARNQWEGDSQ